MKPLYILSALLVSSTSFSQSVVSGCPDNIVVKAEGGREGAVISFPSVANAVYTPASGSFFRLGSHSIIMSTTSGQKCSFTVTVTDNESPTLSPLTLSRPNLWPDHGKMKKVSVWYDVSDNGGSVNTTLSVTSNAPDGEKDYEVVDNHLVRLKSSRLADGSARIYSITVTAVDESGNKTTRTTTIPVARAASSAN